MINKCSNCGLNIKSDGKFCGNSGKSIYNEIPTSNPPQQPMSEQSYNQNQAYSQMPPKKSNKKLIVVLIAIISLVILIAIVFILFLGGGSKGQFVGTWNMSSGENTSTPIGTIIFQTNGDLKVGYMGYNMKIGTWSAEDNKLCINAEIITEYNSGKQCLIYSFTNSGDTLILKDPISLNNIFVLTKK